MKKKVLSVVLAMTMVMGMSIGSFAANINDMAGAGSGIDVAGESTTTVPTIKITVPTTADIIINPFQMEVDEDGDGAGSAKSSDQIVSVKQEIKNESNVAVAVNVAEFKATPSAGVTVSTKSAKTATAKSVYLALQLSPDFSAATPQIVSVVATTAGASKAAALILAAGDTTAQTCQFKITGDCNANPTKTENKVTSADPWTATDKVDVAIKFTFTPQIITPAAGG